MDWRNVVGIIAFTVVVALTLLLIFSPVGITGLLLAIGMLVDPKNAL